MEVVKGPKGKKEGAQSYSSKDQSPIFNSELRELVFRKTDRGQIILAERFYDVLYTAEAPDGEGAQVWTMQGAKKVQASPRK